MPDNKSNSAAPMLSGVVVLAAIATVALIGNFSEGIHFGQTWPVLVIAVGLGLSFFGYWELGFATAGAFLIWLLANLAVLPDFSKSWPIVLIWIALMVVFGYYKARKRNRSQ